MKYKALICFLLMFSLLLGVPAFAESGLTALTIAEASQSEAVEEITTDEMVETIVTIDATTGEETITIEPIDGGNNGEISLMGTFDNPRQAFLKVNTNCYAAPCPTNGHLLQALPANTKVWVVEKKKCTHNNKYYYYAGYNYNGASHRGYFCEDNVYLTSSTRLLPANVDNESAPAGYKVHTSQAGDVYDGPATTYSKMGSVGAESIKLIRTQGNFNFIEYTVTGTGKLKRGFLDYTLISGNWGTLTAKNQGLNGQVMYIANGIGNGKKYLTISSSANNTYATMEDFTGGYGQLFKFTYMDDNDTIGPYFYIQPVIGYDYDGDSDNENRRLAIQSSSSLEHDGRKLRNYNFATNRYQKFWVVKTSTPSGYYKIVPVSSYGTMDWNAKYYSSPTPSTEVVQSYTRDAFIGEDGDLDYYTSDLWLLESSTVDVNATWYSQAGRGWCWVASAKSMASTESPFLSNKPLSQAVAAVQGSEALSENYEDGGNATETAKAANYFMTGNINSGNFIGYYQTFSSAQIRKNLKNGHAVGIHAYPNDGSLGHAVTLIKFEWIDNQDTIRAPGFYSYCYYDSNINGYFSSTYDSLIDGSAIVYNQKNYAWTNTVVYDE